MQTWGKCTSIWKGECHSFAIYWKQTKLKQISMFQWPKRIIPKQFKILTVQLYFYCKSFWVDGSTSAAIYGNSQWDFNMYNCSICDNWFHKYCLIACGIVIPKQNAYLVCNACSIPESLQWKHDEFTNTCTSDNFLTLLLLHRSILDTFGDKWCWKLPQSSNCTNGWRKASGGKDVIFTFATVKIESFQGEFKVSLLSLWNDRCLCLLTHIWRLAIKMKCTSKYCPNQNAEVTKYPSTFSFNSELNNLRESFPLAGDMEVYFGAKFQNQPPKGANRSVRSYWK